MKPFVGRFSNVIDQLSQLHELQGIVGGHYRQLLPLDLNSSDIQVTALACHFHHSDVFTHQQHAEAAAGGKHRLPGLRATVCGFRARSHFSETLFSQPVRQRTCGAASGRLSLEGGNAAQSLDRENS